MNKNDEQTSQSNKTPTVRALNDAFHQTFVGGAVMITAGIIALGRERQRGILEAVRRFDQFDAGNDPYGEHDFGGFEHQGETIFFKIDYFDRALEHASTDPAAAAVTTRVLTIMIAEEW